MNSMKDKKIGSFLLLSFLRSLLTQRKCRVISNLAISQVQSLYSFSFR